MDTVETVATDVAAKVEAPVVTTFDKVRRFVLQLEAEALVVEHTAITDIETLFARIRAKL